MFSRPFLQKNSGDIEKLYETTNMKLAGRQQI